jgi:hypothetical protein
MWPLRNITEVLTTIRQAREARKRVRVPPKHQFRICFLELFSRPLPSAHVLPDFFNILSMPLSFHL